VANDVGAVGLFSNGRRSDARRHRRRPLGALPPTQASPATVTRVAVLPHGTTICVNRPASLSIEQRCNLCATATPSITRYGAVLYSAGTKPRSGCDDGVCHERRQAVRVDTFRLGGAAGRHDGVRSTNVAFLISSRAVAQNRSGPMHQIPKPGVAEKTRCATVFRPHLVATKKNPMAERLGVLSYCK
jgi:hypothetical protein